MKRLSVFCYMIPCSEAAANPFLSSIAFFYMMWYNRIWIFFCGKCNLHCAVSVVYSESAFETDRKGGTAAWMTGN